MSDELLQQAIDTAQRGDKAQAIALLKQIVHTDEYNEAAWLWLARLLDGAQDKQICLENVLTINPHNTWAADQLATVQGAIKTELAAVPVEIQLAKQAAAVREVEALVAGSAPPTAVLRFGQMPLYRRQCPHCSEAWLVHDVRGRAVQTVVCPHCHSVVDVHEEPAARIGRAQPTQPSQPIHVGDEGIFSGQHHRVIGWMALEGRGQAWLWECWLLASHKGNTRWLVYDAERGFLFFQPIPPPTESLEPTAQAIPVRGRTAVPIHRAGHGTVMALAGELTWQMVEGTPLRFIEGEEDGRFYRLLYSRAEVGLWEGVPLAAQALWPALGKAHIIAERQRQQTRRWLGGGTLAALTLLLAAVAAVTSPWVALLALPTALGGGFLLSQAYGMNE